MPTRPDPFAGLPETTEFIVLLPDDIVDDDDRREGLLDRMEAAFPGSTFRAVQCQRLQNPEGQSLVIRDPMVVPMMGGAGEGCDTSSYRRRPCADRMNEINTAMMAFIGGEKALS